MEISFHHFPICYVQNYIILYLLKLSFNIFIIYRQFYFKKPHINGHFFQNFPANNYLLKVNNKKTLESDVKYFKVNNKDTKMRSTDNIYKETIEQKVSIFKKRKNRCYYDLLKNRCCFKYCWKIDATLSILSIKEKHIQWTKKQPMTVVLWKYLFLKKNLLTTAKSLKDTCQEVHFTVLLLTRCLQLYWEWTTSQVFFYNFAKIMMHLSFCAYFLVMPISRNISYLAAASESIVSNILTIKKTKKIFYFLTKTCC